MDCRLLLITGGDYPVPECQLVIHQPTIAEIAMIGEEDFFVGVQMLTLNKMMFDVGNSVLSDASDFQIFMTIINQKETADKKNAVQQVLTLLLPKEKVSFTPQSMIISGDNGVKIIDENNFHFLQEVIKVIFCLGNSINQESYDPANEEAKKIAEKIMRGRKKVAEEKNDGTGSIFVQYLSVLAIGLHIPIVELNKYTVFMVYDQMQRMGLQIEYDLDVKVRLAGGTPQSQPDNWMKNMY